MTRFNPKNLTPENLIECVNNIDSPGQDWEIYPYLTDQDIDLTSVTHEHTEETGNALEQTETSEEQTCNTEHEHSPNIDNIKRSQRVCRPPAHLTDYYYNNSQHWCGIVESKTMSKYSQNQ